MVEEILRGSDELALARLELLSNTAMLKKVLDKKSSSPRAVVRKDGVPSSNDLQHREPESTSTVARRSSTTSTTSDDTRMRRESAFHPATAVDAPHDISPHSYEPPRYAPPAPESGPAYHFNRAQSPRDCPPQMHARPSPYPGDASFGYFHGPHGEVYFMDNARFDPSSSSGSGSHHVPSSHHGGHSGGGMRPPYSKENVPPHHYHPSSSTGMYAQRSTMERHVPDGSSMYPPPTPHQAPTRGVSSDYVSPRHDEHGRESMMSSYDVLARENYHMREQLKEKDMVVSSLQERVAYLEKQISELRQLPTGKISHIPIDDMIRIMQEYGSEVSNQTLPKRKKDIKKASIVRQFRRWNPEFFRYFIHVNGEWVPKLGREGELKRRMEKRRLIKRQGNRVSEQEG